MQHPAEIELMLTRLATYMQRKQLAGLSLRLPGEAGLSVRRVPYLVGSDLAASSSRPKPRSGGPAAAPASS